jgi:nicotinamide-nucleotide amidase
MNAEIISIGTELLRGETNDTNAYWLASQLPLLGVDLRWVTQVGDHQGRLVEAFRRAWDRSDLIVTTGGLGPTADDLTRESLGEALDEVLKVDPELEANLRSFFTKLGWDMPSHNIKQATLIPSADAIPNPRGTAPGWWIEREDRIIVSMPGPPREMKLMWKERVFPRLMERCTGEIIAHRTLKTIGLSEAGVDEIVGKSLIPPSVEIGIYAKRDGIHLRLVAKDATRQGANEKISKAEASLRGMIDEYLWGVDDETLEGVVGKLLLDKNQSLATMESYTGGLLAAFFGDMSESSKFYKGGFIIGCQESEAAFGLACQNTNRKSSTYEEVAWAMACAARERLEANIGIGIAGSQSNQEQKTTASIAIGDRQKKRTRELKWPSSRSEVRQWIAVAALFELWQFLL